MIPANQFFAIAGERGGIVDEVLRARVVRQRVKRPQQNESVGIELARGDDVARIGYTRDRVFNRADRAEISAAHGFGGHLRGKDTLRRKREAVDLRAYAAGPGFRPEEEVFRFIRVVFAGDVHRTAERIAEVVQADPLPVVGEEVTGVELIVAEIFVNIAVEILTARLGDDIHHAVAEAARIGSIVGLLHFDFADGFHGREEIEPAISSGVHGERAVVRVFVHRDAAAIDGQQRVAFLAESHLAPRLPRNDAGPQGEKLREVAAVQGQFSDLRSRDQSRNLAALSL